MGSKWKRCVYHFWAMCLKRVDECFSCPSLLPAGWEMRRVTTLFLVPEMEASCWVRMAEFHSQSLTATAQLLHERGRQFSLVYSPLSGGLIVTAAWPVPSPMQGASGCCCSWMSLGLLPGFLTVSCCALPLSPNSCYPDNSLNSLMYLKNNFIEVKVT